MTAAVMAQGREPEKLLDSVRERRQRRDLWRREGERSLGQNLAWIGVLGWLVVVPTLIGMFAGRWIDARWSTGIFWTVSLLFLGVCVGCYLAWQRMHQD
ncbi:MAG TPA: AtpZ/AtpI family protein [Stellaceae bacterium]|nr:AtpZ/AtpI family protein [Stellaceae bacterium]